MVDRIERAGEGSMDVNVGEHGWAEDIEDHLESVGEIDQRPIPKISDLENTAKMVDKKIEEAKKKEETMTKVEGKKRMKEIERPPIPKKIKELRRAEPHSLPKEDLSVLIAEAEKPMIPIPPRDRPSSRGRTLFAAVEEEHHPRAFSETRISSQEHYQESYASQHETIELREELELLSNRIQNMESTMELVIRERQNLPDHLATLKVSINQQLTLMRDQLHSLVESGVETVDTTSARDVIQAVADESSNTLTAAAQHLAQPPSTSSPLVHLGVSLTQKKKKFKPRK
jgi:hypothetical protein